MRRVKQLEGQAERDAAEKRELLEQTARQEKELKRWDQRYARLAQGAKLKMKAKQERTLSGDADALVHGKAERDEPAAEE